MISAFRSEFATARRASVSALFLATVGAAVSTQSFAQQNAWPTPADVAADHAGFAVDGLKKLNERMKLAVDKREVAGLVTLLVHDGKVATFDAYGTQSLETGKPMKTDTLFRIFSMTKPITGVAMMQLYERGLWKLDDPITKFVPELASLKVNKTVDGQSTLIPLQRPATMREPQQFRNLAVVEVLERNRVQLDHDTGGLCGADTIHDPLEISPARDFFEFLRV